jgi:hypothetical protein
LNTLNYQGEVEFLLELAPDLRGHTARRYPVVLAAIARHTVTGAAEGARQGYRTARTELGEAVPPHAVERHGPPTAMRDAHWSQSRGRQNWWSAHCAATLSRRRRKFGSNFRRP